MIQPRSIRFMPCRASFGPRLALLKSELTHLQQAVAWTSLCRRYSSASGGRSSSDPALLFCIRA
eukprot:7105062-Prymnesium_polylepis.2